MKTATWSISLPMQIVKLKMVLYLESEHKKFNDVTGNGQRMGVIECKLVLYSILYMLCTQQAICRSFDNLLTLYKSLSLSLFHFIYRQLLRCLCIYVFHNFLYSNSNKLKLIDRSDTLLFPQPPATLIRIMYFRLRT